MPSSASMCVNCLSWGVFGGVSCQACQSFDRNHAIGACGSCAREAALKKGYCRLCWMQASLDAHGTVGVLRPFLESIRWQQLRLAGMQRLRMKGPPVGRQGRRNAARSPMPEVKVIEALGWQPRLIDVPKDFLRFDRHSDANLANPFLAQARHAAGRIGETAGWNESVASSVDRALVIVLSGHAAGDVLAYSEVFPVVRRYRLSMKRTVAVLNEIGVFQDDRVDGFEHWMASQLGSVSPGIRRDVEAWMRTLRHGGQRSEPRSIETVRGYLNSVRPVLQDWSTRHDHLREITSGHIDEVVRPLVGSQRQHTTTVLRSLFRHCKKTGTIFGNPAAQTYVGQGNYGVLMPLTPEEIANTFAVVTAPAGRLCAVLAAIHAAGTHEIRDLVLDDIDIGNQRLAIAGRIRPLDAPTRQVLDEWLRYRRDRWPNTPNTHLIINQQTAVESGPVSKVSMTAPFRGLCATIERLRVDRQLEEALHHGPDPLHLAVIFGLDQKTAIRYSTAARQLLEPPQQAEAT